jgi:hypothetical protein
VKRLVCVVEGQGEVAALPALCARVLLHLGAQGWIVDRDPIRQPRSRLVNEREKSPRRPCLTDGIRRAAMLARARPADAILLLCDADDDCPAVWGPSARHAVAPLLPGAAVMAVREYDAWLLLSHTDAELHGAGVRDPERTRNAKEEMRKLIPGYKPSVHQLDATRRIDVGALRARSESFDKLVRDLAELCG